MNREEAKQYYLQNRIHIRKYQKQRYDKIGKDRVLWKKRNQQYKKYYTKNKTRMKKQVAENNRKTKELVLNYYSKGKMCCGCCGEKIRQFLSLDHMNGKTKEEKTRRSNSLVFYKLKKNGFPKGYQVLCLNCNMGKYRNNGVCPHND